MTDATPTAETLEPGQVIDGRYRIVSLLGEGGMGAVYRAEHVTIRRPLAIKVLQPFLGRFPDVARRFEREAFTAGQLNHPNCVGVSDFGKLADGTPYLVMELLDGVSLRDLLVAERRLPPARALHITRHVLRALAHAHRLGIVHRDIKPDNVILVEQDGDRDFAKVLDFGIAMLRGDILDKVGGEQLTRAGMTMGTPAYISPEQAFARDVDARSDVYAVSVMLFEMLAGRAPFVADDPLETLTLQTTAEIPRLSEIAPGLVVAPAVEAVVRHGLAKRREERIASADDFLAEIARLESPEPAPEPAPAPAPPRGKRLRPWARLSRGQRLGAGVGAAVLLILIAAAAAGGGGGGGGPGAGLLLPVVNVEQRLAELTGRLESAATCEERHRAVLELQALGDARAIPALKKARYRMRGGVAGFGASNTNACLRKDAEAAIKALEPRK